MADLNIEYAIGVVIGLISIAVPFIKVIKWLIEHLFKPLLNLLKSHEELIASVDTIKKEVTPNGGGSLKDVVNQLKKTCENIETRQLVIEQRSRSSLQYHNESLFETDKKGNLLWANESFYGFAKKTSEDLEGFNWINIITERDRAKFLNEFNSCISMCRKLEFFTFSLDMEYVKFTGTPYKINGDSHEGFLFNVSIVPEIENE